MGWGLYEQNSTLRMNMERMDRLARHQLGAPVIKSKAEPISDIRLTHPAIFMIEFAQTVIELGVEPVCTLGASLGGR
jgi:hypothetical protein